MSQRDAHILRALISIQGSVPLAEANLRRALSELLTQAEPVQEKSATAEQIVGLNDLVKVQSLNRPEEGEYTLQVVLPPLSDVEQGKISVFAPMSLGLLGRRRGDVATIETPAGPDRLRIVQIDKA